MRAVTACVSLLLLGACRAAPPAAPPVAPPVRRPPVVTAPLALRAVTPSADQVACYERLELRVDLSASWANPFDADDVRLEARVEPPTGEAWTVPGFRFQAFERRLEGGRELLAAAGEPDWRVRLALVVPGTHRVTVSATDRTGTVTAPPLTIEATPADAPGFIRRAADPRYFATDRGEGFFPLGANVCWGDGRGTYAYDAWLPKYADAGANWFRIWLSPGWVTVGLQNTTSGFDGIDLQNAWRLDYICQQAERLGLRVMLCIDSFNILRSTNRLYGLWEESPYTAAHGGPLAEPREYFTHPTMREAYRDRLRYLVARYGYSTAVFAWEFWNEVDIVDQYDSEAVTAWHVEMARYLRSIDPWRHLISTSTANPSGDARLDAVPEMEFVQTHHYGARDMARQLGEDRERKAAAADRPHFHGEFGIGHDGGQTARTDPTGVHLRNALFSCLGQQQAGTPMTWWWDSYVEPNNLYPLFAEFARWLDGFDPVAQRARPVAAEARYSAASGERPLEEVVLRAVGESWSPAPFNQPVTVTIARDGTVTESAPIPRVLHGVRNHPTLHNPTTFELDLEQVTTFVVLVDGVSGHGGAGLVVTLDGREVRRAEFADDRPDDTETMTQYNGEMAIEVAAGRHRLVVENPGADWCYVSYRLPQAARPGKPPVRVMGLSGDTAARIWVQNPQYTWAAATSPGFTATTYRGLELAVAGLRPGRWRVRAAGRDDELTTTVANDGVAVLALPDVTWDVAMSLEWLGP